MTTDERRFVSVGGHRPPLQLQTRTQCALRALSTVVAVDQPAEAAEDGAFFASAATGLRCGCVDAAGETRERQRLQPDFSWTAQRCEEKSFTAEQRCLDA